MAQSKKKNAINIEAVIKKAVERAVEAGMHAGKVQGAKTAVESYRETEKRLYAYPTLLEKNRDDREQLEELERGNVQQRSKSIVRFSGSGMRLSEDEMLEALIVDLRTKIARDAYEIELIRKALESIADDGYYLAVTGKYIDNMSDEEIAEVVVCDASTVRRNRGRLVRCLAVRLYGSMAI